MLTSGSRSPQTTSLNLKVESLLHIPFFSTRNLSPSDVELRWKTVKVRHTGPRLMTGRDSESKEWTFYPSTGIERHGRSSLHSTVLPYIGGPPTRGYRDTYTYLTPPCPSPRDPSSGKVVGDRSTHQNLGVAPTSDGNPWTTGSAPTRTPRDWACP